MMTTNPLIAMTALAGTPMLYIEIVVACMTKAPITLLNTEYMRPLYHTGTGQKLLLVGVVMIGMGSLMLRKIVSFKGLYSYRS